MAKLSPEIIEKLKDAQSAEELIVLAKEYGVVLSNEAAEAQFAELHAKQGELSDDELDNVSGGGCGEYHYCPVCGAEPLWSSNGDGGVNIRCPGCGAILDHDSATGEYTVKQ